MEVGSLAIVIPTYRRPSLLAKLLADLDRQTRTADTVVVVDGDPNGARAVLAGHAERCGGTALYVRSNHSNLPYQRWLGMRAAAESASLLYLDDDVRLPRPDIVEALVKPLETGEENVAAVTAPIVVGSKSHLGSHSDREAAHPTWWSRFGVSFRYEPGELAPNGERIPPCLTGAPYERVGWLRGGAMAIRRAFLADRCFPEDLFALAERGWGLGEDTILSRHLLGRGDLVLATEAAVEHPGEDPTRAYSRRPRELGYATAYSRRLINDHYRGSTGPTVRDRRALVRSLASSALLECARRPSFGLGYVEGAIDAFLRPPCTLRLCPEVDWKRDSAAALADVERIREAPIGSVA